MLRWKDCWKNNPIYQVPGWSGRLPVETVTYRKESVSATADYKTGKLTTYTPITLNGLLTALPSRVYSLESIYSTFQSPNSVFQLSSQLYAGSTSSFPLDPRYAQRATMNGYDANGNLTGYTVTNGATTTFGYSAYTPSGGVLFSVVTGQTQNAVANKLY